MLRTSLEDAVLSLDPATRSAYLDPRDGCGYATHKRPKDLSDKPLPMNTQHLSQPAVAWLLWAHSSVPAQCRQKARELFLNVRWWVYLHVAETLPESKREPVAETSKKLMALCEAMIHGNRCGQKILSNSDIANTMNIDRAQLHPSRKWGKVRKEIERVFAEWEAEVDTKKCR